jgi:thiol:disulfide interchange protein DsbA
MRIRGLWQPLTLMLGLLLISSLSAAQVVVGRDYRVLQRPQPTESGNKIEVVEFFYYGCPHCNNLQAPLESWLKRKPGDVQFRRQPAVFDNAWLLLAAACARRNGISKLHQQVFAIHGQSCG